MQLNFFLRNAKKTYELVDATTENVVYLKYILQGIYIYHMCSGLQYFYARNKPFVKKHEFAFSISVFINEVFFCALYPSEMKYSLLILMKNIFNFRKSKSLYSWEIEYSFVISRNFFFTVIKIKLL